MKTKFVVTGHFDGQLYQIRDKVLVSLGGFPSDFATIHYGKFKQTVFYIEREGTTKATFESSRVTLETPRRSSVAGGKYRDYDAWVEKLFAAREQVTSGKREREEISQQLLHSGIPKKHVREYLAGTNPP